MGRPRLGLRCSNSTRSSPRTGYLQDFDSLARLLGPADQAKAGLTDSENQLLSQLIDSPEMTEPGNAAIDALLEV